MPIRRLPDDLVNRIAAGEVVERPASVIKELVENSIDAGASRIEITTERGGKTLMRVEDNGSGMIEDDLVLSIERHATSKLSGNHLDAINSLGFRGEALASIGSVSDLSLRSRPKEAQTGRQIVLKHGKMSGPMPVAMNKGTIVEVKNLFSAVPARLKFLKSERAETAAITDVIKRLAMASPNVHFVLEGADRQTINWPAQSGETARFARIKQVMGDDFAANCVPVAYQRHSVVVTGLAALPTFTRANSLSQFFFVNFRSVRDKILIGGLRAAYADFVFRGRFPVAVLSVAIDPKQVDVNVHPAKAELRFSDPSLVRSAVIGAIGSALVEAGYRASSHLGAATLDAFKTPEAGQATPAAPIRSAGFSRSGFGQYQASTTPAFAGLNEPSARFEEQAEISEQSEESQYPLGAARAQLFENFIVAQSETSLVLIDQHAAHERLVYEKFKSQLAAGKVASQTQLIPIIVELAEEDCARLEQAAPTLEKLGLVLEKFGPRAISVRESPAILGQADVAVLINDLADGLAEWDNIDILSQRMEAIIGRMACHGSVRSGRRMQVDEMNALLRQMENSPHSGQCIHGRPTYVELKKSDIERLFGR
ncbi:DNA mismatch repair protein MutL [hydrothermal vent metagenome]|uniref:DNA mismatch repair protein MutL n=1 Tax=hydrothermal vent metagenome TaxID=652676 RepID=A0A3B0TVH1_9ZZZZ